MFHHVVIVASAALALGGCERVFGVDPPSDRVGDATLDGDPAYDRCAPTVVDDPLRYRLLHNPKSMLSGEVVVAAPWSWDEARADCLRHGMDLAVLNDEHELGRLEESFSFWIGQKRVAGTWSTVDECAPYTPDTVGREGMECGIVESALAVSTTACDGTLPPQPEDPETHYVPLALCETPRAMTSLCGARPVEEITYTTSASPMSRAAALAFCSDQNAALVEVDSFAEWKRVAEIAGDGKRYWTGATFDGSTWRTPSTCPMVFSWSKNTVGEVAAETCVATSLRTELSEEETSPVLDGVAPTACDAPDVFALCER